MLSLTSSCNFSYPKDKNKINEDAILNPKKIGNGYLFAIADGVGSYNGAHQASNLVIQHISDLTDFTPDGIENIFHQLKKKINDFSDNPEFVKAATTLTFAYLNPKGIYIGHIGDCRLYVKDGKKLKLLTHDHTQHQKLLDEKIYTKTQLKEIGGKNILLTAISKYVEMFFDNIFIPLSELPIENNRLTLFIMSDGTHSFWDNSPRFSENTMSSAIKFSNSLLRRIEKKSPIDDYSLVSAEFEIR